MDVERLLRGCDGRTDRFPSAPSVGARISIRLVWRAGEKMGNPVAGSTNDGIGGVWGVWGCARKSGEAVEW